MEKSQLNRGYTQGRSYSDLSKNCQNGKSCGASCISSRKVCEIELPPSLSKSLSKQRDLVDRIQGKLDAAIAIDKPLTTEAEVVQYVKDNYKEWLTGVLDERFYGGPGQRGVLDSKAWFLGQEAYDGGENRFNISVKNPDPVAAVNAIRLHNNLYQIARKEAGDKAYVTAGVEQVINKKPFDLENITTVEHWVAHKPGSYFGRLGRVVQKLGYSGNLLGANASSFLMPSGQKALDNLSDLLRRNGVNTDTFAGGALKDKESWYKASVEARYPLMMRALKKYKPEIVYIGQQSTPEAKKFSNMLMYKLAKNTGLPVNHVTFEGKDFKYVIVPLPGDKRTVVMNGWHGNVRGKGEGAIKRQEVFLENLLRSLKETGEPPKGVKPQPVSQGVMNKVLK